MRVKKRMFAILPLLAMAVAACGEAVQVPPAHVGKILTSDGFREGALPPEYRGWFYWDKRSGRGWLAWPGMGPIRCHQYAIDHPYPDWLDLMCKENPA